MKKLLLILTIGICTHLIAMEQNKKEDKTKQLFEWLDWLDNKGDLQRAQELIDEGADVNARESTTPIFHHHVLHPASLWLLSKNGLEVNAVNTTNGDSVLHVLLKQAMHSSGSPERNDHWDGRLMESLKILLAVGADMNIQNKQGDTPLMSMFDQVPSSAAARSSRMLEIVRLFLSQAGLTKEIQEKIAAGSLAKEGTSYLRLLPADVRNDFVNRIKKNPVPVNLLLENKKGQKLLDIAEEYKKELAQGNRVFDDKRNNKPTQNDIKAFNEMVELIEQATKKQLEQAARKNKENKEKK